MGLSVHVGSLIFFLLSFLYFGCLSLLLFISVVVLLFVDVWSEKEAETLMVSVLVSDIYFVEIVLTKW